jgi:hypothetical protein
MWPVLHSEPGGVLVPGLLLTSGGGRYFENQNPTCTVVYLNDVQGCWTCGLSYILSWEECWSPDFSSPLMVDNFSSRIPPLQ